MQKTYERIVRFLVSFDSLYARKVYRDIHLIKRFRRVIQFSHKNKSISKRIIKTELAINIKMCIS